jgi:YesN/AraC family two-component response regulator
LLNNNLFQNVADNFFLSTHIPTKVITAENELIASAGFNDQLEELFKCNFSFTELKKHMLSKDKLIPKTITYNNNIKLTLCSICPVNADLGYFVLGPYISEPSKVSNVVYKPEACVPHLISLLYAIRKDLIIIKTPEENKDLPYSHYVKKSIFFINANYSTPLELKSIADYVNINKSYFCTIFKQETGKTYSQYLNEIRVEKSKELLKDRNASVLDIALAVGFNNQNYFNMTFKKLTKLTPLQFRSASS